uniref:Defensin-like cystein-rich peptide n=1 Tax=Torenia fournieri TaxID=68875 RepID=B9ZZY4_9LAMI|nr:defensin-like cystein-rich peptide [Torenia fournieri]
MKRNGVAKVILFALLVLLPFSVVSAGRKNSKQWWTIFKKTYKVLSKSPGQCIRFSEFGSAWCDYMCYQTYKQQFRAYGVCDWSFLEVWLAGDCQCTDQNPNLTTV